MRRNIGRRYRRKVARGCGCCQGARNSTLTKGIRTAGERLAGLWRGTGGWRNSRGPSRTGAGQARGWTLPAVDHALAGLLDVDRLLKASPHTDEHFLECWLLGLRVFAEAA